MGLEEEILKAVSSSSVYSFRILFKKSGAVVSNVSFTIEQ